MQNSGAELIAGFAALPRPSATAGSGSNPVQPQRFATFNVAGIK